MTTPSDEFHLPPRLVAAYLEGGLSVVERSRTEEHLASCATCRRELVEIKRLADGGLRFRRLAPAAGVAAAAVLAVAMGLSTISVRPDPVGEPVVRSPEVLAAPALSAVAPAPGASLSADDLRFVWNAALPGSMYRVSLVDATGRLLWTGETADTTLAPPAEIGLEPFAIYFWFVDALLADGSSRTTGARSFRIR